MIAHVHNIVGVNCHMQLFLPKTDWMFKAKVLLTLQGRAYSRTILGGGTGWMFKLKALLTLQEV